MGYSSRGQQQIRNGHQGSKVQIESKGADVHLSGHRAGYWLVAPDQEFSCDLDS